MTKKFNITGICIPERHYMVDIGNKLKQINRLIEDGEYFTINRPRQYGKTTTLLSIEKSLKNNPDFLVSSISFEGVGDLVFYDEKTFAPFVLQKIAEGFGFNNEVIQNYLYDSSKSVFNLDNLSKETSTFIRMYNTKVVLIIDEVDKSSNNQLFLSFLGMLRNKYLQRNAGKDYTFHSVILAGVHDVKTLKLKIRRNGEQKYNSPWNIAADFKVDMSFNPNEITTMLVDYVKDKKVKMDIPAISERIYHYTSGYPFLVSRVCKEVDEILLPVKNKEAWTIQDIDIAVKNITEERNTNFDSLLKNIINNNELYLYLMDIISGNLVHSYNPHDEMVVMGEIYGFLKNSASKVVFHNKIYEEVISNFIISKLSRKKSRYFAAEATRSQFIKPNNRLNIEKILLKFQEVIKEKYSKSDVLKSDEFLEKDLRLLFLVFLKPIINGIGFSFKEVETSEEKRLDIVIIFKDEKFVVELKLWRDKSYHKQGIIRLKDYMHREGVKKGFMLIMDKTRSKEFTVEHEDGLMMVWI
ncbi:MAG: AAA family ATPase [Bacteroidia bacterium]|nr:AAA family ATPase [Bacteroidia bacterium]